jgi:hypothetical protein
LLDIELTVGIADKLYQCRTRSKAILGIEYKVKIDTYISSLKIVMDAQGFGVVSAVIWQTLDPEIANNKLSVMLFKAAAIEIWEGK